MADKKGKYTLWVESAATGTSMYQVDSYEWLDMKATTYLSFVESNGKTVYMNDFTIRNVVVEAN